MGRSRDGGGAPYTSELPSVPDPQTEEMDITLKQDWRLPAVRTHLLFLKADKNQFTVEREKKKKAKENS